MTDQTALLIASVCLYSTGHWIGGSVLLLMLAFVLKVNADDPTGMKRMRDMLSR